MATDSPQLYEVKRYRNTPQNVHHIEGAENDGFEVYERNAREVRLRRPLDSEAADFDGHVYR